MRKHCNSFLVILALTVMITLSASAQVTLSFAPQGSAVLKSQTGQVIKSVQIFGLVMCGDTASTLANGRVYQTAAANNISYIMPDVGAALVNQTVAMDKKHFIITLLKEGAIDAALGGVTGVIHVPSNVVLGLGAGHLFMDKFGPQLESTASNPAALLGTLLDPNKVTSFAGGPCSGATMLAVYSKGAKPIGPVQVGTSLAALGAPSHDDFAEIIQHRIDVVMTMRRQAAELEAEFNRSVAAND